MGPPSTSRLRWLGAAVLAALSLGHAWEYLAGSAGITSLTNQFNPYTGGLDLVPFYIPGTPGELVYGYQAQARLFLVTAVVAALLVALGVRAPLVRRAALVGLIAAFVLALSGHEGSQVLTLGLALALVGGSLGRQLRDRFIPAPSAPNRSPAPGVG